MQFTLLLPHDVDSIPRARRALDRVRAELDDLTLRNARLLVSELVTNVVRHVEPVEGGAAIELSIARVDGRLRVEVADRGPGFEPAPREDSSEASSGWGLHILEQLASSWGIENGTGTRVWFELEVAPARRAASAAPATAP